MSIIKFCSLGGLGEVGKNMSVVEVDDKIFILDAGLKFPSAKLYGIESVIPDFEYLITNANKIQGVFVSHGHLEHCGAITALVKELNIPIYCSYFTLSLLREELKEAGFKENEYKLLRVHDNSKIKFDDVTIEFFRTTHSIPDSIGINICTEDGIITYIPDFTFRSVSNPIYRTSFDKIGELAHRNVLMVCSESLGVNDYDRVTSDIVFEQAISDILTTSKRVLFSMYATDLSRIQQVIDLSVKHNRRIALLGRKAQRNISVAMDIGYLKIPTNNFVSLKFMDDRNQNDYDDLVVIIAGHRHEPYFMVHRMATGKDKLIRVNNQDTVVMVSPPVIGTERLASRTIDTLYKLDAKVINISKKMLVGSHANGEDLKLLYQMIKPKFILPIAGEYRHQYAQRDVAESAGFTKDKIIMLSNGEQVTFRDGDLIPAVKKVPSGDVLIDGSLVGDINELVIRDREILSEAGTVSTIAVINSKTKQIVSRPRVVTKGFMTGGIDSELETKIVNLTMNMIFDFFEKKSKEDVNDLRNNIRDSITRLIRKTAHMHPIVISAIIDTIEEE